ncbi:MAG: sialate O-acetylesterase [Bacteroidota bacterium]
MIRNLLLFLSLSLCFLSLKAKKYRLYYLGGQSNMEGYGYTKDLPEEMRKPMDHVMIYHGNPAEDNAAEADGRGLWQTLRPGHGVGFSSDGERNQYSKRFGLELSFARQLQAQYPDESFAFIKYAKGGTSIDSLAAKQFGCWEPDFRGKTGINQWDHFLATMRSALAVQDIDGDGEMDELIPCGILWMQGESDATISAEIAHQYESHLKRLIDLIRATMHTDDLAVVIGKISESGKHKERDKVWVYGEIVMEAQEAFVRKDPFSAIVRSTKNYAYSDPWHYNSPAYIDLGKEFAKALFTIE